MADVFIALAWIAGEPLERSRRFIRYGLGALKLSLEHRKAFIEKEGGDAGKDPLVKHEEGWLNAQRFTFLTEVELGSWSGISTREMAIQAGHDDFYNHVYSPFSACSHSMWHHIARYNLIRCENPLHRYHHEPMDPDLAIDPHYLYLASKYLEKTFACFDEAFGVEVAVPSSHELLVERLNRFRGQEAAETVEDSHDE